MAQSGRGGSQNTFDAGAFGTLRYDFKAFGGVQGIIPDPSDQLIEDFMRGMRDTAKRFQQDQADVDGLSDSDVLEMMDDDSAMQIVEAQQAICQHVSELCQGSPNTDQLLALPFRVRQAFMRWLQGKLLDPEGGAAGTTNGRAVRAGG